MFVVGVSPYGDIGDLRAAEPRVSGRSPDTMLPTTPGASGADPGLASTLVRAPLRPDAWVRSAHLLVGAILSALYFVLVFPWLVAGFVLLPFALSGTPFLWVATGLARTAAHLERARLRRLLGVDIPPSPLDGRAGVVQSPFRLLRSRDRWRELAYCAIRLPLSVLEVGLVWGSWIGGVALVLAPFYLLDSVFRGGMNLGTLLLLMALGAVLLLTAPWLARAAAHADVALVRAQLAPSEKERLRSTRAGVVDAADAERRRIERDLHDGAQQRLVALAMGLGVARSRYDEDPEAVRSMIVHAHEEAKAALVEMRELVRGIHPAVLSDRGLDAALSALAARCAVPVEVDVEITERADVMVESAAYFIAAEALTNVAKHSGATRARIGVSARDGTLRIEVADDGGGGADATRGTGIAGLQRRVAAIDGTFLLDSPPGGPTRIVAELPCAS